MYTNPGNFPRFSFVFPWPPQGSHNGLTKVPQIKKPKSKWQQDFQGLGLVLSNLTNVSLNMTTNVGIINMTTYECGQ